MEDIQQINGYGRRLLIHGVNLSVGYEFEPEWFACGQSPLCVEVDRLVRSGVVVVVAAGNTGYGWNQDNFKGPVAGRGGPDDQRSRQRRSRPSPSARRTATCPTSTESATSRRKGPTGDGRLKPDLVAPGEKILSCAAGRKRRRRGRQGSAMSTTWRTAGPAWRRRTCPA